MDQQNLQALVAEIMKTSLPLPQPTQLQFPLPFPTLPNMQPFLSSPLFPNPTGLFGNTFGNMLGNPFYQPQLPMIQPATQPTTQPMAQPSSAQQCSATQKRQHTENDKNTEPVKKSQPNTELVQKNQPNTSRPIPPKPKRRRETAEEQQKRLEKNPFYEALNAPNLNYIDKTFFHACFCEHEDIIKEEEEIRKKGDEEIIDVVTPDKRRMKFGVYRDHVLKRWCRDTPRDPLREPPHMQYFIQEYEGPNAPKHPKAHLYGKSAPNSMIYYVEDDYWTKRIVKKLPMGVVEPPIPRIPTPECEKKKEEKEEEEEKKEDEKKKKEEKQKEEKKEKEKKEEKKQEEKKKEEKKKEEEKKEEEKKEDKVKKEEKKMIKAGEE